MNGLTPTPTFKSNFSSHKNNKLFLHPEKVFVPNKEQQAVDLIICYCLGKTKEFNFTPRETKDVPSWNQTLIQEGFWKA